LTASELREMLYPVGSRVRAVDWHNEHARDIDCPVGTVGEVVAVLPDGTLSVRWDNGRTLAVTLDDRIEPR